MTDKKAIGILAKILSLVVRETIRGLSTVMSMNMAYPGYEKDLQKVIDWSEEE